MEGAEGDGGGDVGGGGASEGTKTLVCVLTLGVAAMTDTPRVEEMVLRGVRRANVLRSVPQQVWRSDGCLREL